MATPIVSDIKLKPGDKVGSFMVKRKIGEGSCGQVYLVTKSDSHGRLLKAAMKIEPLMKCKEDEVLKIEILVLLKLHRQSEHVCTLFASGRTATYTFLVMNLLGPEIETLRRLQPNRRMSSTTTLRLGMQLFQALEDIHKAGFIHRDIKPSNIAMKSATSKVLFVFDFGLARMIFVKDKNGVQRLREPRQKVMFRGTVRYCSLNVHQHKEQGRHDDLISALHSLIECNTASLPWKGMKRKEAARIKETTKDDQLCKGCPPSFQKICKQIQRLTYQDLPNYKQYIALLRKDLPFRMKMTDPFEWEKQSQDKELHTVDRSVRDAAEKDGDKSGDNATVNDVAESVITEETVGLEPQNFDDFDREDTLDGL